ncbi:MAG: LacI family DNA-binding transcriptional regulator [Lachnospiraceae bacterium]|nr:LacI family DNA-binding transcriptional regulator [Lachnospiraceae bacterium]
MGEITIKDIARLCNVGVSTVSRAINNHPDITAETKQRIMDTIQEYGYVPNNSARNLKRTDAKCIAILVKGMTNPFFADMIQVMEECIQKKKYAMVMRHVEFDEDEVDIALELIKEKRLRGIVFLGGYFHSNEKLEKIQVPFILSTVGCPPENMSRNLYSSISVDDCKESYRMTEYLICQGKRRIAILTATEEDGSIGSMRLQGYRNALAAYGIEERPALIRYMHSGRAEYSMENGYSLTQELINLNEEFDAIFAISDVMAIGACRALHDSGIRVPEDISVAGFDGLTMGDYFIPAITTMRQPAVEMAHATMEQLFAVIGGKKEHQHIVFEAQLLEKESVKKALERIAEME